MSLEKKVNMNFKCDAEQLNFSVDVGVLSKLIAGCLGQAITLQVKGLYKKMWALFGTELSQICNIAMGVTRSQVMMHIHVLPKNVGRGYNVGCCLLAWMGLGLLLCLLVRRHLVPKTCGLWL